ncbi:MAG: YebC/PmpR family DNA-binding transcriptional regulator [Patescibacteria group bacterium]
MSGHSKWSTIKRQKGVADTKRGQLFTKLIRAITLAARQGVDSATNFTLRMAIDKARQANMPKDNIERAIRRGSGEAGGTALEEITYEAYGPGSVALVINAITDNRQRTASEIKHILSRFGGRLAEANSVKWQFESKGIIQLPLPKTEQGEQLELELIEAGALDLTEAEGQLIIYTPPSELDKVKKLIESKGLIVDYAQVELVAANPIAISDPKIQSQLDNLKEALDNSEEVDNIYTNEA